MSLESVGLEKGVRLYSKRQSSMNDEKCVYESNQPIRYFNADTDSELLPNSDSLVLDRNQNQYLSNVSYDESSYSCVLPISRKTARLFELVPSHTLPSSGVGVGAGRNGGGIGWRNLNVCARPFVRINQ